MGLVCEVGRFSFLHAKLALIDIPLDALDAAEATRRREV